MTQPLQAAIEPRARVVVSAEHRGEGPPTPRKSSSLSLSLDSTDGQRVSFLCHFASSQLTASVCVLCPRSMQAMGMGPAWGDKTAHTRHPKLLPHPHPRRLALVSHARAMRANAQRNASGRVLRLPVLVGPAPDGSTLAPAAPARPRVPGCLP